MKIIAFLFFSLLTLPLLAQPFINLKGNVIQKISSDIPEGSIIVLEELKTDQYGKDFGIIRKDDKTLWIREKELENIDFSVTTLRDFWKLQGYQNGTYANISKSGMQYDLRKELEADALEFLNHARQNNLIFEDAYLESYLYSLVNRIYPQNLSDGRPGIVNVMVIKDTSPNAFMFSNGSMFISTGLLSTVHSEDELLAIVAHEIAHFVLDHSVMNINHERKRKKRAEFWAAFATGVAAVADIYISSNSDFYLPGSITLGTAALAFSLADAIHDQMGLKYSWDQEVKADRVAKEVLTYIGADPSALSSVLTKVQKHLVDSGDYWALSEKGTHPAIESRIHTLGEPGVFLDPEYDKRISLVTTFNSIINLNNHRLTTGLSLSQRNIEANVATEEDYLNAAIATVKLFDTEEKNNRALNYIQKAKTLSITPLAELYKHEALLFLRLENKNQAMESLKKYREELEKRINCRGDNESNYPRGAMEIRLNKELNWTAVMLMKLR